MSEARAEYTVSRISIVSAYGKGLGNLPQLLRWQYHLWRWLVRYHHEFDVIHACDFDTILPALWCKWIYRKKVVYDIFDFYADHLRNTPKMVKEIIRKIDLWAVNQADAVIIVDDSRQEQIMHSLPKHLTVIYNTPEDVGASIIEDTPNNFSITYVGLLQIERGILELVKVLSRHPEWSLELAGFGGDEDLIRKTADPLPNVHWHGRIDYQTAIKLSQLASVLIATYDPAIPNHRYSSPNKVFEAMMLAKPIIVAKDTNMDTIIQDGNCGIVVNYGNENDLETALARLANEPKLINELGANARKAYEGKFSWRIMAERLINLYRNVVGEVL